MEIAIRPDLTEASIEALTARASEYTVWDNHIQGLGVRVRTSGYMSFVFYYRVRYQKKLHKITIGVVKTFSLASAREMAKSFALEARMGIDPSERLRDLAHKHGARR